MHYNTLRYRKRIKELQKLLGGKCVACGSKRSLEFHHIIPEDKAFNVSFEWDRPWKVLLVEIKKCELRCHKCHLERHKAEHGLGMYSHHKCRCAICKAAWNKKTKEYKLKRKLKLEKENLSVPV